MTFQKPINQQPTTISERLAHSSVLLIENCDEKKNVKAIRKKKKLKPKKSLPYSTPFFKLAVPQPGF